MDIYKFCEELCQGKLDEQIAELEADAQEQLNYSHPLKRATTAQQHKLGEHNKKAAELLKGLKEHLLSLTPD